MLYLAARDGLVLAQESAEGGSLITLLLFLAVPLGLLYVLMILPRRRQMKALEETHRSLDEGDEIRTVGGIYGTITAVSGDDVEIDIGGGTTMRIAKRAVAEKLNVSEDAE